MAAPSYAQGFPDSLEVSREAFRPSALFLDSPSSFRPVPRGGRNYDFSSSAVRSSSHSGSRFPSLNTFPSTPFSSPASSFSSSSHEFSSYASVPSSPSSPSFFSSPSVSFSSDPSFPVITRAAGVEILNLSDQDSRESFGLTLSSTLGFGPSGATPYHINHGNTRIVSPSRGYGPPPPKPNPVSDYKPPSLLQSYGPPPKPKLASAYETPSLPQTYGAPPKPTPSTGYLPPPTPTPLPRKHTPFAAYKPPSPTGSYSSTKSTPRPVFGAPSPFSFDSRSRERFTSSEFPHSSSRELGFGIPETIFGTSIERFDDSASLPRSFGGLNLRPLTVSRPRDTSSSHEVVSSPRSFGGLDFRPLSFSGRRDTDSRETASSPKLFSGVHFTPPTFSGLQDTSNSREVAPTPRPFGGLNLQPLSFTRLHDSSSSREANLKSPLSISFVSTESLDSREFFGSNRGFFKTSSHLETPAKPFQPSHFGPLTPSDSRQSSSTELFSRTRDHARPVVSSLPTQVASGKTLRPLQSSSVGVGLGLIRPEPKCILYVHR